MANVTKEERKALKAAVAGEYGKIQAAESVAADTVKEAAPTIKALVDKCGPGPHKFSEPDGEGGTRVFFLTFRKNGDTYGVKRADASDDDE